MTDRAHMGKSFWDDRFQRQAELLQAGPKKPWQYYIPKGCGRPNRKAPINVDDVINLHKCLSSSFLDSAASLDQFCERF